MYLEAEVKYNDKCLIKYIANNQLSTKSFKTSIGNKNNYFYNKLQKQNFRQITIFRLIQNLI